MEMKVKENVNYRSFTFRKRVIGEALDLIGKKRNYITNDIYFVTMIAFVNNIVEDDIIIKTLYDTDKLEEKITTIIEPVFNEKVLAHEDAKEAFDEICTDIVDYIDRDVYSRVSVSGFLYDILDGISEINLHDFSTMITEVAKMAQNQFGDLTKKSNTAATSQTDTKIRDEVLDNIDNAKMKALIESFARKEGAPIPEQNKTQENTAE